MPTWILRKNVDGERVGQAHPCASPRAIVRSPGALTVEERTACLLAQDENAKEPIHGRREIYNGNELVGYIVIISTEL